MEQLDTSLVQNRGMRSYSEYYKQWHFKHPNPNDFVKLAEDVSGIQLDWYKMYFVNTKKTIDYGIDSYGEKMECLK
jgi:hypothetical protein